MMTLILALDLTNFPQEYRSHIKSVFHELVKSPTITEVKSKLYTRVNIFDVINSLGVLQDDWLKNDHPIGVPILSSYTIELH